MNRRSFLKLSLASAMAAMVPSALTKAIADATPATYRGWECEVSRYKDTSCWRVLWTKGGDIDRGWVDLIFDGSDSMAQIIKVSKIGVDNVIRRAERRVA